MTFEDFIYSEHEEKNADDPFMDDVDKFDDYLADLDVDDWVRLATAWKKHEVVLAQALEERRKNEQTN